MLNKVFTMRISDRDLEELKKDAKQYGFEHTASYIKFLIKNAKVSVTAKVSNKCK